jgi:hypothetical protein
VSISDLYEGHKGINDNTQDHNFPGKSSICQGPSGSPSSHSETLTARIHFIIGLYKEDDDSDYGTPLLLCGHGFMDFLDRPKSKILKTLKIKITTCRKQSQLPKRCDFNF